MNIAFLALSRVNAPRAARDVAELMCNVAGSPSIYAANPLDGLLPDAATMNPHIMTQDAMLKHLGEANPLPIF